MRPISFLPALSFFLSLPVLAQLESSFPAPSVQYKVIQDDPLGVNPFWIHVQPVLVDASAMNLVVGSGLELTYVPLRRLELKTGFRTNFVNRLDARRQAALLSSGIVTQESKREQAEMVLTDGFRRYMAFEAGGFYTLRETTLDGLSKITLDQALEPEKAAFVSQIEVNARVRQCLGIRAGFLWSSGTVSVDRALEKQNAVLTGSAGSQLSKSGTRNPSGFSTPVNANSLFTGFTSSGFYLGGGMQRTKNISIKSDRQGIISNNSIVTFYGDLIFNPWTRLSDISARKAGTGQTETFGVSGIRLDKFGARAGFEIRYNQASFLSVGAELGYRPAIQGQGAYALIRLAVPTFSMGLRPRKPASNVGKNQSLSK